MSKMKRVISVIGLVLIVGLGMTGCTEDVADSVSFNSKVISNIKQYAKDRYGADIEIDHVIRRGGISSTREYIADVSIDNTNYMFTGTYDNDGSYKSTSDTVIDTVVNAHENERVNEIMKGIFNDYRVEVSAKTYVSNECNFGKVPTYDGLIEGKYLSNTSSESVIGIVYCDLENIKTDLRGKTKDIRELVNKDIKTNVALYLVDSLDKERVERFISSNDLVSILSVFNSSNKLDTKLDCCTNVIRFGTNDYDRMDRAEITSYIDEIKKTEKKGSNSNGNNTGSNGIKDDKRVDKNSDNDSKDTGNKTKSDDKRS